MSILKLIGFTGESPKVIPRLLSDTAAQLAFNVRLDDGGLTPVRKRRFDYQFPSVPTGGFKTIYKEGSSWVGWDKPVYVAHGPVATDRLYIFGDGAPKMKVAGVTYPLAVSRPTGALSAVASGTPSSTQGSTRLYVYTWVTGFGEESEPSPASNEVYWQPGQIVTLSGFAATPAGRNITTQRIYRSQTSTTGTVLYLIAERGASAGNFVDNVPADAFQEALPSTFWTAPPDDLTGLVSGPNGMMAAFRGKQVYFCEPYRPHAWPEPYVLTTDYPIVGLAWFGSSLAIMTTGVPYVVTGTAPESMVMEKTELNLPCINARGIVEMGSSVVYPSHDGLVVVSMSGTSVVTSGLFSRDDWLRLNPQSMVGCQYNGRYFASYSYADANEQIGTFIFDLTGEQPFLIRSNVKADAMYYELGTGLLYMLVDGSVYEWDSLSEPAELMAWRSKLFVIPKPTNFGAILVEADSGMTLEQIKAVEDEIARIMAENAAIFAQPSMGGELGGAAINEYLVNGDMMKHVPTLSRTVSVSVYADRKLVATVGRTNKMVRLPAGFLATLWEVEVSGDTAITQITLAGTGAELAGA